jgi:hypothetical protein
LYGGKPDDIIKLSDLAFYNAIPEVLPQLHTCESLFAPPSAKPREKLSTGNTLLLDSEKNTVTSLQLPTNQAFVVSKNDVDNPLHAYQLNVELKLPDSGSRKTDATTHKDARLDPAATVVPGIVNDNPHTDEAACQESPEKPANKPPMIIANPVKVFNKSPTVNSGRQEELKLATCGSFDLTP